MKNGKYVSVNGERGFLYEPEDCVVDTYYEPLLERAYREDGSRYYANAFAFFSYGGKVIHGRLFDSIADACIYAAYRAFNLKGLWADERDIAAVAMKFARRWSGNIDSTERSISTSLDVYIECIDYQKREYVAHRKDTYNRRSDRYLIETDESIPKSTAIEDWYCSCCNRRVAYRPVGPRWVEKERYGVGRYNEPRYLALERTDFFDDYRFGRQGGWISKSVAPPICRRKACAEAVENWPLQVRKFAKQMNGARDTNQLVKTMIVSMELRRSANEQARKEADERRQEAKRRPVSDTADRERTAQRAVPRTRSAESRTIKSVKSQIDVAPG